MSYDIGQLPITSVLAKLEQTLATSNTVVLQAPPGSGKTTRVPLALLEAPWLEGRRIVMLEPRRLAATNAARYMASLSGEAVGETVGYAIRYERRLGPGTRLEVLTEGLLTRRLQSDPELAAVAVRLQRRLGTQVRIVPQPGGKGGKIEIAYYSAEELERLLEWFAAQG